MLARVAALLLVLLGVWARCTNFRTVLPSAGEVELLPSDSHYYTRFAKLQLRAFPRYQAFDPLVNYPEGATVILPPLHALAVASAVGIAGEERAELGAAWVGPALSLLELLVLAALAWAAVGSGPALVVLALFGLTPALVDAGALGNADHHLHEGFLAAALALQAILFLRAPSTRSAIALGALLGVGRWLAPAAFMFAPCVALALAIHAAIRPVALRPLMLAGAVACALCALGTVLFGAPLSLEYEALSAFHPLLLASCFAGAVAVAAWRNGARAVAGGALAAGLGMAAIIAAPILRAAGHLGRTDPLLGLVTESEPLLRDPRWALQLLGAALPMIPAATYVAARSLRRGELAALGPLAMTWPLVAAAAMQARFAVALAGAAAALIATSLPWIQPQRLRAVAAALLAAPLAFSLVPQPARPMPADIRLVRPTLRWMKEHLPPASPDPYGAGHATYGVVATHLVGHALPLWAERPTVATLFSQRPVHVEGNARAWDVFAAATDAEAYRRALATGAKYVLATPQGSLPGHGGLDMSRTLLHRLLEDAWSRDPFDTTAHFRLVHDSDERRERPEGGSYARLFEVVPGALLRGRIDRAVGPQVAGRPYARAGSGADLRVAYPGRYEVSCKTNTVPIDVTESDVEEGKSVTVPGCY
jgi:dolichyl-diphosphooligosaccharide--protein glycosyltransferase